MAVVSQDSVVKPFSGLTRLPVVRQIGLLIGLALSIAVGVGVVSWSSEPNYVPLFSDLSERDMAPVISVLDREKVKYRLQGGTVAVSADKIHNLRIKLASQGLPKGGMRGFELLEEEQSFGTSSFLETARYHQALEGELSKSVSTLEGVRSARVHLAVPKRAGFLRNRAGASASVLVALYPGSELGDSQIAGIVHLVASSVPGMSPDSVSVVDQRGSLLTSGGSASELAMSTEQYSLVRKLEHDYSQRIVALLAPVLGADKVRAQVTADMDFTSVERTSEVFGPDNSRVRSEQVSEQQSKTAGASGVPGALSNQPPPPGTIAQGVDQDAAPSAPQQSSKQATTNYELDRTISHINEMPGTIRRLSVAVVLDYREETSDGGEASRVPLPPEEIERYTQLVREAVGFNAERGDSINVVNASFLVPPALEPIPETPIWKQEWVWTLGKQILAVLGVALLIFGVLRPVMNSLANYSGPLPGAGGPRAMVPGLEAPAVSGELQLGEDQVNLSAQGGAGANSGYERQIAMAQAIAKEDPKRAAQVVKGWVAEDE